MTDGNKTAKEIFAEMGLDEEQMATLSELNQLEKPGDDDRFQQNLKAGGQRYEANKGLELIGKVSWVGEAYEKATRIRFAVTQLPEFVSDSFGEICKASEVLSKFGSLAAVDVKNFEFVCDESDEEKVLVAKARPSNDPVTGEKYGKETRIIDRPVTRVMVVREGDLLNGVQWTPYQKDDPKTPRPGKFVVVRGLQARVFESAVSWNIGAVLPSNFSELEANRRLMQQIVARTPRNKIVCRPLKQAPMSAEERLLKWDERTYVPEYETSFLVNQQFLMSSDKMMPDVKEDQEAFKKLLSMKYNVFVHASIFPVEKDDYVRTIVKQEDQSENKYAMLNYAQIYNVKDHTDSERPQMHKYMMRVELRSTQCAQIMGISDPMLWGALAPQWLPEIRFMYTASIDHAATFSSDVNKEATKPVGMDSVEYQYTLQIPPTAPLLSNFVASLLQKAPEVPFDYVVQLLSKDGSGDVTSSYTQQSYFNNLPMTSVVNLNEYTGSLKKFEKTHRFFVALESPLDEDQTEALKEFAGDAGTKLQETAAALRDGDKASSIKLGAQLKKTSKYVVFALQNEFCDVVKTHWDQYALNDLAATMRQHHLESDLSEWYAQTSKTLDDPKLQKKRKRPVIEESGFSNALDGSDLKRAKVTSETKEMEQDGDQESAL